MSTAPAWAVAHALGPKLGIGPETLRKWVVQAQTDAGARPGPNSEELAEIERLKKENADLMFRASSVVNHRSIQSHGLDTARMGAARGIAGSVHGRRPTASSWWNRSGTSAGSCA